MNLRSPDPENLRQMRILLKAAFDCVAAEPIPQAMHDLVRKLK